MNTVLIDYGAGNLHSVHKALELAGLSVTASRDPAQAAEAEVLVLPGQGHFRQVMEEFQAAGFEPVVRAHLAASKPFLGICVGLQLLMQSSEEAPGVPGLSILAGSVKRFDGSQASVPQMGWNQIYSYGQPALLGGIPEGSFAYFANSYYVDFDDESVPGAMTQYAGVEFKSVISQEHIHATQFHPEKSQRLGLAILRNFAALAKAQLERI